ncbi:MAG: hypothetical protein C0446_13730 [Chitinophaga sp.]|nr:hypothetical protein [Chitinophaga sp.]
MNSEILKNKICTVCKQSKHLNDYCNHPLGKDGKQARCKICDSQISKVKYKTKKQMIERNRTNG